MIAKQSKICSKLSKKWKVSASNSSFNPNRWFKKFFNCQKWSVTPKRLFLYAAFFCVTKIICGDCRFLLFFGFWWNLFRIKLFHFHLVQNVRWRLNNWMVRQIPLARTVNFETILFVDFNDVAVFQIIRHPLRVTGSLLWVLNKTAFKGFWLHGKKSFSVNCFYCRPTTYRPDIGICGDMLCLPKSFFL